MSRASVRQIVFVVAVALLLAACVPDNARRPSVDELLAQAQENAEAAGSDGHDHGEEAADPGGGSAEQSLDDPVEPQAEPTDDASIDISPEPSTPPSRGSPSGRTAAQASDEPASPVMQQRSDFPITATLGETCVERGGEMTLTVDAGHDTAVVYIAYYAGGETGAPPPYGDGHGGNHGDMTDGNGRYEHTWVVSPMAPVGPARVEVKAARNDERSTAVVRFEVVEAGVGGCER